MMAKLPWNRWHEVVKLREDLKSDGFPTPFGKRTASW
jgi:hypothetical protein